MRYSTILSSPRLVIVTCGSSAASSWSAPGEGKAISGASGTSGIGRKSLGLDCCSLHPSPNHFDEHHLRLMTIVANQATVAVRNAQLFNQVQQQQRQLEVILHAIPDILLVLDDDGKILMVI